MRRTKRNSALRRLAALTAPAAMLLAGPALAQNGPSGELIFDRTCKVCHMEGGLGTMALERRLGKDKAMLQGRTDLTPEMIRQAVKQGIETMPPVPLTDEQLAAVVDYLTD